MTSAPPLRFLALAVAGWVCLRAGMLVPAWLGDPERAQSVSVPRWAEPARAPVDVAVKLAKLGDSSRSKARSGVERGRSAPERPERAQRPSTPPATSVRSWEADGRVEIASASAALPPFIPAAHLPLPRGADAPSRWSASAWAFWRRGESSQLAAGGLLGGSQAGARIGYRLNRDVDRPLSISARVYAPVDRPEGSEAALGLEWKPIAALPVRILAERRQAIGPEGRSAFALMAYGGIDDVKLVGGVRLQAYGQAGVVGARSRDLFADGVAAAEFPVDRAGRLRIGAAVWGAAQPDISRIDVGPRLSLHIPVEGSNVRLSADWRMRVAGNASPASGPSLTLATDF